MKKLLSLSVICFLVAGCALSAFNGDWSGGIISTKEDTETQQCASADIDVNINNGQVTGEVQVGYGYTLTVKGTVNEDGKIEAELWGDDDAEATITGQIEGDTAGGTWSDTLGCYGTFDLARK